MLTMVIPAYNEQAIIARNCVVAADELARIAHRLGERIDLVVLDDGSTDATAEQVRLAQVQRPDIGYHRAPGPSRRENLAKLMAGLDSEYVGWMDADLSTSLAQLEELVRVARLHDIVTGSRYLASSRIDRHPQRLLISRAYNATIRRLYGSRISDHWCGFKIFRREALVEILHHIGTDVSGRQMFWDAQMWVCAQRLGLSILEIPVSWTEGQQSALRVHTELPMALYTLRYWIGGSWRDVRRTPDAASVVQL